MTNKKTQIKNKTTIKSENKCVVGFPLYQGSTLLDFAGATQVFAFSGGFKPIWLAPSLEPITTSEGVTVNPTYTFSKHPRIDLLFIPGGGGDGVAAAMQDNVMLRFVKKAAKTAQWSGSVCTGAFILAAAGLLDGCKATTYWSVLDTLNEFPAIRVDTEVYPRYLIQRKHKRFTGGGVSSSIDLALKLVQTINSKRAAEMADLSIQYAPDPPVQSGDPSQASRTVVAQVRHNQQTGFIEPIAKATQAVIYGNRP